METNARKLSFIIRLIDLSFIILTISLLYSGFVTINAAIKYESLKRPNLADVSMDNLLFVMKVAGYFQIFKMLASKIVLALVLFNLRKVIKSMQFDELFKFDPAHTIKKIASYFLWLSGILIFFNVIFLLAALNKEQYKLFWNALGGMIMIFQDYLLIALIAYGIAEVFTYGKKLREETDLTI